MKRIILGLVTGLSLVLLGSTSHADTVSVALDVPIRYDFDQGGGADEVSGFKVAVQLPFLAGIGFEDYTATLKSGGTATEVAFSIVDCFLELPFPAINIGLGIGFGTAAVVEDPATPGRRFDDANVFQYFFTLGYPVGPLFDIHLGYHVVSGSADLLVNDVKAGELNVDGNMLSLGVKIGF